MALAWWEPRPGWIGVFQTVALPLVPALLALGLVRGVGFELPPMEPSVLRLFLVHAVILPWVRVWIVVIPARVVEGLKLPLLLAAVLASWPVSGGHLMHGWPYVVAAWPCYAWATWLYLRSRGQRPDVPPDPQAPRSLLPWRTADAHLEAEVIARRRLRRIQFVLYTFAAAVWWWAGLPWWVRTPI